LRQRSFGYAHGVGDGGLVAVAALALLAWIVSSSTAFDGCIQQHENGDAYSGFRLGTKCVGVLVEQNGEYISALSAALIAVFTFTLWNATRRLWQSAESQLIEFRRSLAQAQTIADQQAAHLGGSVTEAARAASAMEKVATSIAANVETTSDMARDQRDFWKRQMRAYVSARAALIGHLA
jgi:hypothetical protein